MGGGDGGIALPPMALGSSPPPPSPSPPGGSVCRCSSSYPYCWSGDSWCYLSATSNDYSSVCEGNCTMSHQSLTPSPPPAGDGGSGFFGSGFFGGGDSGGMMGGGDGGIALPPM
eukprot:207407-Prymnesium_polylepis.1